MEKLRDVSNDELNELNECEVVSNIDKPSLPIAKVKLIMKSNEEDDYND